MAFSTYLADALLNWFKGSAFPSALSNVYISIHTGDPGTTGTSNDVTSTVTGSINRTGVASSAFTAAGNASGGGREVTNTGVIQITASAANPSTQTITHFGVWTAATGGSFLSSGQLTTSIDVQTGDVVQFNIGALAIRFV